MAKAAKSCRSGRQFNARKQPFGFFNVSPDGQWAMKHHGDLETIKALIILGR